MIHLENKLFHEVNKPTIYVIFYIQCVKACAIPYPNQLPTRGGNKVSVAKVVLPPLAPPAAFATGQDIIFRCKHVSLYDFYATASQIFQYYVQ